MSSIPKRVIVIDDDEGMRDSVSELLTDEGYRVDAYATAEAALEAVSNGPAPDVILLDYRVPEMGAEKLVTELAARGISAPILLVTGASRVDISARLLGAVDLIQKPFGIGEFLEALAAAMGRAR